jgi:hypothetical protein
MTDPHYALYYCLFTFFNCGLNGWQSTVRPPQITDELQAQMSALLAEGMPYTEVASVVGKSEYFVRKYCPGQSQWTPQSCGAWAQVVRI